MIMELQSCLLINPIDFDYIYNKVRTGSSIARYFRPHPL